MIDCPALAAGAVVGAAESLPWMGFVQARSHLADRACRYRGSGELVPLFRRPGTGPRVRRAGTVGGYSQ